MRAFLLLTLAACSEYELNNKLDVVPGDSAPPDEPAACALEGGPYTVTPDEACRLEVEPGGFDPVVEWQWTDNPYYSGYDDLMATPAVANLTDDDGDGDIDEDDTPDVVFTSFSGGAYSSSGTLTAISGDGTGTHWSVYAPGGYDIPGTAGVAIGDLDGDGRPEVCAAGSAVAVVCLTAEGTLLWAAGTETYAYGCPSFADLEGDGAVEVVFGREIFSADGTLLATGADGQGRYQSFGVDVDGDGLLEIAAGNTLYNADGTTRWTDGTDDGSAAAGDVAGGGSGGPPTVADFDGDGAPEIGVAGAYYYSVIETDGSTLWSAAVYDASSNITGSAVFDFEGDGKADVVYADELTLWVYDGATGEVKLQDDNHASGTLYEYPLIVDVDGDGATEIVLASNDYRYTGWHGITVIGDASGTWRPSRPVWNQFAYHITNIDDDGAVPAVQESNWTRWNSFRAADSLAGRSSDLADLAVGDPEVCTLTCGDGEVDVLVTVHNAGLYDVTGVGVALVGDGVAVATETVDLASGEGVTLGPYTLWPVEWGDELVVEIDPAGEVEECDEIDNRASLGPWPCD